MSDMKKLSMKEIRDITSKGDACCFRCGQEEGDIIICLTCGGKRCDKCKQYCFCCNNIAPVVIEQK